MEIDLDFAFRGGEYRFTDAFLVSTPEEFIERFMERAMDAGRGIAYGVYRDLETDVVLQRREAVQERITRFAYDLFALRQGYALKTLTQDEVNEFIKDPIPLAVEDGQSGLSREEHEAYETHLRRGNNLFRDGLYPSALDAFQSCLKIRPEDQEVRKQLVLCLLNMNEALKALAILSRLLEEKLVPHEDLSTKMLEALRRVRRHNEADIYLEALERLDPNEMNVQLERKWREYQHGKSMNINLDAQYKANPEFTRRFILNQWRFTMNFGSRKSIATEEAAAILKLSPNEVSKLARRQAIPCKFHPTTDSYSFFREEIDWYADLDRRYQFLSAVRE